VFGLAEVRFESDMRIGGLMGIYWAAIGWVTLLIILDVILMVIVTTAVVHFGSKAAGANAMLVFFRQHPYLAFGANIANYLVLALCIGVVIRVYLTRGLWERVVTSAIAHDLEQADGVQVRGAPASALGEGFADSLDVAGF
jgi:hypothetical protein